jgi:hypothetical protein
MFFTHTEVTGLAGAAIDDMAAFLSSLTNKRKAEQAVLSLKPEPTASSDALIPTSTSSSSQHSSKVRLQQY